MPIDLPSEVVELRKSILTMGAAVEQRVGQAITSLLDGDSALADYVRANDHEIDEMEIAIEQECLRVLALTQPVARDLRLVLAVMRINSELERIADLARSISKRVIDLSIRTPLEFPPGLESMARGTQAMLSDALTALTEHQVGLAQRVRQADQRIDDLQKEIFTWAQVEIPLHVESTASAIDIVSVARKLERIADMSTNIAEEVIFLVEGTLARHTPVGPPDDR